MAPPPMGRLRHNVYPCSKDGAGDKLHFCQPGPVDWALDVMVRQISRGATSISARGGDEIP